MEARFAFAFRLGSLAAVVALSPAARAEVEFAGYMRTPQGEARFVLADSAAQKTSDWLGVGGSFAGYRVTGFEAKSELLAVEKDGATRHLRLKNTALAAAGAGPARNASPPTKDEAAIAGAVRLIAAAEVEQIKLLTELQKLLGDDREALRLKADKLRPTLPDGHPEILQLEADIAKFTQKIERNQVELERARRGLLLAQIRTAGSPEEKARLEDGLRVLDERIAKAGAAVAPPLTTP